MPSTDYEKFQEARSKFAEFNGEVLLFLRQKDVEITHYTHDTYYCKKDNYTFEITLSLIGVTKDA